MVEWSRLRTGPPLEQHGLNELEDLENRLSYVVQSIATTFHAPDTFVQLVKPPTAVAISNSTYATPSPANFSKSRTISDRYRTF